MSQTEFQLLQEQLKGMTTLMNSQFLGVNERLDKINGKVAHHEEQINEALVERARNREEQKHVIEGHILNCPQSAKLEKITKDLEDVNFLMKHPKLFISGLVFIIILTLATFLENNPFGIFQKEPAKTEIPK